MLFWLNKHLKISLRIATSNAQARYTSIVRNRTQVQSTSRSTISTGNKYTTRSLSQAGFVGLKNSFSHSKNYCELVTMFTFDSKESFENWKHSPTRQAFVEELDKYSYDDVTHAQFHKLGLLLPTKAQRHKIEMIVILIF